MNTIWASIPVSCYIAINRRPVQLYSALNPRLRDAFLVFSQLQPCLCLGRLARRVPHNDERGRAPLSRGNVRFIGVHRQARDGLFIRRVVKRWRGGAGTGGGR